MYRPGGYVSNPQYMPGPGGPPPYQQHYGTTPPQQQNYNYGPPANMPGQHPLMSHEINTQMHFTPNQVNHYSGNPYGMPNFAAPRPTYEQQQYPGPPTPGPPPQFSMPQAVTSHAPHMQPPAFSPVPQNFPQNYANPSYQNPQLSQHQQQQQQQQQQYPVYASQQVNSQFPNLPQVPPQAPPPEPSEEPAFSMDSAASGKLLPPPPPPPSDEEMVQNIEVLSEFVARNGPDFENMARAKENGNQKFSFLFNGAPGSDAAVGHQYYQWMKKKWELEINGQKFQHDQPGMQLESSGARQNMVDSNAAANSPPRAASDMEMDDDLAPVDPVKLKNVSPQELTHTKMAQLEEVKPRELQQISNATAKASSNEGFKNSPVIQAQVTVQNTSDDIHKFSRDLSPVEFPRRYGHTTVHSSIEQFPISTGNMWNSSNGSPQFESSPLTKISIEQRGYLKDFGEASRCAGDMIDASTNSKKRRMNDLSRSPKRFALRSPSFSPVRDENKSGSQWGVQLTGKKETKPTCLEFLKGFCPKGSSCEFQHVSTAFEKIVDYSDEGSDKSKEIAEMEKQATKHHNVHESTEMKDDKYNSLSTVEEIRANVDSTGIKKENKSEQNNKEGSPDYDIDLLAESYSSHLDREIFHHSSQKREKTGTLPLRRDNFRPLPLRREDFEPKSQLAGLPRRSDREEILSRSLQRERSWLSSTREDVSSMHRLQRTGLHTQLSRENLLGQHMLRDMTRPGSLRQEDSHVESLLRRQMMLDTLSRGNPRIHDDHLHPQSVHEEIRLQSLLREFPRLRGEILGARDGLPGREDPRLETLARDISFGVLNASKARFDPLNATSNSDSFHSRFTSKSLLGERYGAEHDILHLMREPGYSAGLGRYAGLHSNDLYDSEFRSSVGTSSKPYPGRESISGFHPARAVSAASYDPLRDSLEPALIARLKSVPHRYLGSNVDNANRFIEANGAADAEGPIINSQSPHMEGERGWSPGPPLDAATGAADDVDLDHTNEKGRSAKDKAIKNFRTALADFVKELLKPTWREGTLSKEGFKTIVKKTVDKVAGTLQSHQVPTSQEKVDHYLESSRMKLSKLVEGYIEKFAKG